ncbi:hypothetical protein MNBD_GAMMA12-2403 [hydrothermal vent metagenome]|uniref:Uncharacterized protein n=1 Tax=hydrothermal vent metagenome TaxID=652676 RepID=A0A3B0YY02_9ZZZZ
MEIIVEKVSAIFLLVLGLSYLINPSGWVLYAKMLQKQPQQFFSLFILILLLGSTIVVSHNVWVASPIVIVTLLGWIMLIKGVMLLLFPKLFVLLKLSDQILLNIIFTNGVVLTAGGGILVYLLFIL